MKEDAMNNEQIKPGYNLQIVTANQYLLNYGFYPLSLDIITLEPFLHLGCARFGVIPKVICADTGYGSQENYNMLENNHIQTYAKYNYFHQEQKKEFTENPFRIET